MNREEYMCSQICYIKCGDKKGAGFLVAPNQIITARHVVFDAVNNNKCIEILFDHNEHTSERIKYNLSTPNIKTVQFCSFITLPECRHFQPLLLKFDSGDIDVVASTRILCPDATAPIDSYSFTYKAASKWLPEIECQANITLEPSTSGLSTYEGFSGSPIIVGNCIDGMLVSERTSQQKVVRVYGIVGKAFQNVLKEANIQFLIHKENPKKPCVFKSEKYEEYLQTCLNKSSLFPFAIMDYIHEDLLFNEIKKFISYNWLHELLVDLHLDKDTKKILKGYIDEIDVYESLEEANKTLSNKVRYDLDCNLIPQRYRDTIMSKLGSPSYNNCIFISGYYGSGKTRLAIETALSMRSNDHKTDSPVFLIVRPSVPEDLFRSLNDAFFELLDSKNTLSEYIDAFANNKLCIVLDDVHEYFQSGVSINALYNLIKEHSRPYVKWIVMMQTGAGIDADGQYKHYFTHYAYKWSRNLRDFLIGQCLQLDAWYRNQDIPARILKKQLATPLIEWNWKESVSSTIYYNPLLIDVLLIYEQTNKGQSIFTYNNFLYPEFCKTFFNLLSLEDPSIKRSAEFIAKHLRAIRSLFFKSMDNIDYSLIKSLIDRGLLMDTAKFPIVYKCIPEIVWYYLISQLMHIELLSNNQDVRYIIESEYWKNNPIDFTNILSLLVLSGEDLPCDNMKNIWETLFECRLAQVALDSGFKCNPFLRNELICISLKYKISIQENFSLFLKLCSLGRIDKKLFCTLIEFCIKQCTSQLKDNCDLFTYMLLQNYNNMSWEDVLDTLSYLNSILTINADIEFVCKLGRNIGRIVAQKADKANQLETAIEAAYNACNNEVSNKRYYPSDGKYHNFPVDLYDGFCSDFCNTIIKKYHSDGYEKFNKARWYTYKVKTDSNNYRRNLSLTFALAHEYRYQKQSYSNTDSYVSWYEHKLVEPLSKGDVAHKTFALFLIIHTKLREDQYKIEKNGFLWNIADTFRVDKSMRSVLEKKTCRTFYKYNFDNQSYYRKKGEKRLRGKAIERKDKYEI